MRFNKGSKVEVLSCREVPSGSWHRAEIISGNGRKYMVKYEVMAGTTNKTVVERVTREAIRPCPPPLSVSENWIPGDIVEVFDNNSWKMATVAKVLGKRYFLIRLLGSSQEFKVSKSYLRMRQYYQDDRWVMMGKVSGNCGEEKHDENINMKYNHNSSSQIQQTKKRKTAPVKDGYSFVKNKGDLQESRIVSSQTLKRASPHCYSLIEASVVATQKFRAVEEEGRRRRLVATYPSLFSEQVDDVASTRQMVREKYMHDRINGFSETDAQRRKPNDVIGCSLAINLDSNDADSDICSVGSCSISSNNSHKLSNHLSMGPVEETDGHLSDAESFYRLGYEEGNVLPRKEELAAEIHRLELHAYRCTIEALHASGPLSWEQEEMVTNLRLSLHISNDEHLVELRNLVSSHTSIPIN